MAQTNESWYHISLTCNIDTCSEILSTLAQLNTDTYGKVNLYSCERPDDAPHTEGQSSQDIRPFGAPD